MKTTEKISFIAAAIGIAAGFGAAWLLPAAHWGVYVGVGVVVTTVTYGAFTQQAATDRIANRDVVEKH